MYQEGYNAFLNDEPELSNPHTDLDAEFWSDGWADAQEDESQNENLQVLEYEKILFDHW
ncbi:ribosome modulation factor [Vibrio harveyi]|uniref:ribosome modulation factor n=1 Tax=Vibrio harveyi TaxID=669 RepID=UPI003BB74D85